MKNNSFIFKSAFSLPEVLIVLSIIATIAALTIPPLVNKINKDQLVTALRKNYAALSAATERIAIDHRGSIKGLCNDNDCLVDLYRKYLLGLKECESNATLDNCWHSNSGTRTAKYLNGFTVSSWPTAPTGNISATGAMMRFTNITVNCDSDLAKSTEKLNETNACGNVMIDVNGFAPPNTIGRDIFHFAILENRLVPYGTANDTFRCTLSSSGYGCAAKVLTENAINY